MTRSISKGPKKMILKKGRRTRTCQRVGVFTVRNIHRDLTRYKSAYPRFIGGFFIQVGDLQKFVQVNASTKRTLSDYIRGILVSF